MKQLIIAIGLLFTYTANAAVVPFSFRFADTIQVGNGDIDLFNPQDPSVTVTGALLEALRKDSNGELIFAVDVNEAASGLEKATSQGVTVDKAVLKLTFADGTTLSSDDTTLSPPIRYYTQSQSLVARKQQTVRQQFYTLLGDSGSNHITGGGISSVASAFDATLRFDVGNRDLTTVTAARLQVTFLDTAQNLGDPEAFYDFSNGYEDIGLLTYSDGLIIDQQKYGWQEAPLVLEKSSTSDKSVITRLYYPSSDSYYMVAYEDLYPARGDYDFNDLVVGYRIIHELNGSNGVVAISGEGYLVSRGAKYSHDWHLRIPLTSNIKVGTTTQSLYAPGSQTVMAGYPKTTTQSNNIDITLYEATRDLWPNPSPNEQEYLVNTTGLPLLQGHFFSFRSEFDSSANIKSVSGMPYDPYLYVRDTNYEIHLQQFAPVMSTSKNKQSAATMKFTDENNYPFALMLPKEWIIPVEGHDLGEAYPDFVEFVTSNRTLKTNWYNMADQAKIKKDLTNTFWMWKEQE